MDLTDPQQHAVDLLRLHLAAQQAVRAEERRLLDARPALTRAALDAGLSVPQLVEALDGAMAEGTIKSDLRRLPPATC